MSWLSEPPISQEIPSSKNSADSTEAHGPFYTPPPVSEGIGWCARRQLRTGIIAAMVGVLLLSFGTHNFIARISIIGKLAGWSTLLPRWPIAVSMVGGATFVVGIVFLVMALINSRDRLRPAVALALTFVVAFAAAVATIGTGQVALQKNTVAEANLLIDQITSNEISIPEEKVEWASEQLTRLGIQLPDGQELADLLPSGCSDA